MRFVVALIFFLCITETKWAPKGPIFVLSAGARLRTQNTNQPDFQVQYSPAASKAASTAYRPQGVSFSA